MPQLRYSLQDNVIRSQHPLALEPDRSAIDAFLAQCHRRRYPNKTVIMRPGDPANTLYYVISGSVTITTEDENGRELILAYVNRGEFIGEMGVFVASPHRDVMVRTRNVCELAEISYERLFQLFDSALRHECSKVLFAIGVQLSNRLLQS
ncbi:MAG: cyclic nucleotide-binding domain-containing protein, partial [Xanthomonadales bacterium]|nr:cyclic nucleotide-binding domain-containing protein [Xanthomonadales bacterium]